MNAKIEVMELLGSETYLYLNLLNQTIIARVQPDLKVNIGKKVNILFDKEKICLFDKKTEKAIF